MSLDWLAERPGREEDLERGTADEEEERASDLPDAVPPKVGGTVSVRGLPSGLGLRFMLAVSCGILRALSTLPAPLPDSFLASEGCAGAAGVALPNAGPVLKRTAKLSPKKE